MNKRKIPVSLLKYPSVYLEKDVAQRLWIYCEKNMLDQKKVASKIISHYLDEVEKGEKA